MGEWEAFESLIHICFPAAKEPLDEVAPWSLDQRFNFHEILNSWKPLKGERMVDYTCFEHLCSTVIYTDIYLRAEENTVAHQEEQRDAKVERYEHEHHEEEIRNGVEPEPLGKASVEIPAYDIPSTSRCPIESVVIKSADIEEDSEKNPIEDLEEYPDEEDDPRRKIRIALDKIVLVTLH
ncbi:hypothetical protein TIFTF001_021758 [Ficus carica]|uniref:Uncharacterized protein n=1 Tax=Ficus carica TaxID=3494 RepID=A0AA88AI27_FICCA|nr:hypothetical protein TIFTF001_021758 [Ficus carica]